MFNYLKRNCLLNTALKLYSPISNQKVVSNIRFHKFNSGKDTYSKFGKLALCIGIPTILGVSYFQYQKKNGVNFPEMIRCQFRNCYFFSSAPQSPRKTFNFVADVVEKAQNSVVYIEVNARHPHTGENISLSNGSGFIVKKDGLILTNAHVINHYGHLSVKLYDGSIVTGVVEDIDIETDLATVRIKVENLPVLPLGSSSDIKAGEFVIAMGHPLSLNHTITAGVVSSVKREGKELGLHQRSNYIQTDASIHDGNSGGPLVNLDGEVIGINAMKFTDGISFAIPSDYAIRFLKSSEEEPKSGRYFFKDEKTQRFLGITMLTLSPDLIKDLRECQVDFAAVDQGVLVWLVLFGSPSYEAGIRSGDVITEVDHQKVTSAETILNLVAQRDSLALTVNRGYVKFEVTVKILEPIMR